MIKAYKKRIKRNIEKYCDLHYEKINLNQMELGSGLFNQRCQMNALQQVKEGKMKEVYSCICFNDSHYPVVHFINKDDKDKFVDNTLGFEYEFYKYYLINRIDDSQFNNMNEILMNIKESVFKACSNWFLNKLLFITYENLGI
jgi:hypothetical protein